MHRHYPTAPAKRHLAASVSRQSARLRGVAPPVIETAPPPKPQEEFSHTVNGETFTEFQSMHHWSGGSTYYFSEAEMDRLHPPGSVQAQHRRNVGGATGATIPRSGPVGPVGSGSGSISGVSAAVSQEAGEEHSKTTALIHGSLGRYPIDLTIPLLHKEERERWAFEAYFHRKGFNIGTRLGTSKRHRRTLLPQDALVTYLGEEVQRIDQAHRHRGFFTVSEVAEVFIPVVPTYPVETRHVFAQLPLHITRTIEDATPPGTSMAVGLFGRYPLIFNFLPSRYRRALVQLNSAHWFVRQHPGFGKADKVLQQFRVYSDTQDLSTSTYLGSTQGNSAEDAQRGGRQRQSWRARLLGVLASQLPRKATPTLVQEPAALKLGTAAPDVLSGPVYVKERYESRNLVKWISSFPPKELEFINKTAELPVLHCIAQHVYIFQLMSLERGDHNLFVEAHVFLAGLDHAAKTGSRAGASTEAAETSQSDAARADGEEDDDEASASWWTANSEGAPVGGSVGTGDAAPSALAGPGEEPQAASSAALAAAPTGASSETLERERNFKQAVADELIGLDELAAGVDGADEDEMTGTGPVDDADAIPRDYDGDGDDAAGGGFDEGDADLDGGRGGGSAAAAERQEWERAAARQQRESGADGRGRQAPSSDAEETTAFGLPLEKIYIRRIPPDVAPRSLSDLDQHNSPDPELVQFAASFLGSPRSVSGRDLECFFRESRKAYKVPVSDLTEVWRWVPVERIYAALSVEQRQHLRQRYKGLVNFLRYHGKVFELSSDYRLVIAHDPEGTMAPIPHLQRNFKFGHRVVLPPDFDDNPNVSVELLGESARKVFAHVLGEGTTPTCRRHMLLLDPDNPMMVHQILYDEIANLTPETPTPMRDLIINLPPLMRACLPTTINLGASRRLETFVEKSVTLVRRREKSDSPLLAREATKSPAMSAEDAVAELLQVPFGTEGMTIRAAVQCHLSREAVDSLADHFGSVTRALRMLPQYFEMVDLTDNRKRLVLVRRK